MSKAQATPAFSNRRPEPTANKLDVLETPWGYVLHEVGEDHNMALRLASSVVGGACLLAAFAVLVLPGQADFGLKLGFTMLLTAIGLLLVRFARQPGLVETEIDFERAEIRVVSQSESRRQRRVLASTRMRNIKEFVLARNEDGPCLAFVEYAAKEVEVLAVGNLLTLSRLKSRLDEAMSRAKAAHI